MRSRAALTVSALLLCASGVAAAEITGLPVQRPLELNAVSLDLRGGRVSVLVDPGREPSISVTELREEEEGSGFVLLKPDKGALIVRQPYGSEDLAPPLSVELVVGPDHRLEFRGADLQVFVNGANLPEQEPRGEDADTGETGQQTKVIEPATVGRPRTQVRASKTNHSFVFDIAGGNVYLAGVGGVYVTAKGSRIDLLDTHGDADIAVQDGVVETRGHRGGLLLTGDNTEFVIDALQGAVAARVTRSVFVAVGDGSLRVDGEDSDVIAQQWRGPGVVDGQQQRVEVSDSGTADETFAARGEGLTLIVNGYAGHIAAEVNAGRADIRDVGGRVNLTATRSATVRVEDVRDITEITLKDSAVAEAFGIGRLLKVRMDDSRLDAGRLQQIDLQANESFVRVEDVSGHTQARLRDTEAEIELSGNRSLPNVTALGTTVALIKMNQPCAVRLEGRGEDTNTNALELTGCVLIESEQRRPVIRSRADRPPVVLTLSLKDEAVAEVVGSP